MAFQWRDYDPAIGRFNKIDRFAEKYVDASPYHYTSNNPIAFREIAGDSILVHFKDKNGKALKTIPKAIQQMFNDEFGIDVGYNSKTNMLYFDGEVSSELSQSSEATGIIVDALKDTNTGDSASKHGTITFGYNLRTKSGAVSGGAWDNGHSYINMSDFDSNGNSNNFNFSSGLNKRAFNMARTFEHEYLGHQRLDIGGYGDGGDYTMGRVVNTANAYARQRGLSERLHYGGQVIFFGSTSSYGSNKEQRKAVKKMVNGKIANDKFIKRKRRN